MTPAMRRARAPFFWKNLATFVGLFSLIGGVYGYAMYVTRPDDFGDIPVPPINDSELASLKAKYEKEAAEKNN
ncbi:hypothetical protein NADFUDRAFT_45547 [Nadsonia fulvescens var. elongata DSM 6958]|uniref:Cytochrome c oxidase assembly factor 3 n=1 Tax=Nadsonia fulvescens var. elongata DSM 6958 TaxID=857566 RepID=A0A1E3PPT6_9ASCO|nr:hypothetical protein NADFUDRAFT_45547 [Nadsonia fulvescens var. elongata DSM 6958]